MELEALSKICHEHEMRLFVDGARLAYALLAKGRVLGLSSRRSSRMVSMSTSGFGCAEAGKVAFFGDVPRPSRDGLREPGPSGVYHSWGAWSPLGYLCFFRAFAQWAQYG